MHRRVPMLPASAAVGAKCYECDPKLTLSAPRSCACDPTSISTSAKSGSTLRRRPESHAARGSKATGTCTDAVAPAGTNTGAKPTSISSPAYGPVRVRAYAWTTCPPSRSPEFVTWTIKVARRSPTDSTTAARMPKVV